MMMTMLTLMQENTNDDDRQSMTVQGSSVDKPNEPKTIDSCTQFLLRC